MSAEEITDRVRAICLRLPEATERLSHGSPGFFAGKQFVMLWAHGHHDHEFPHLWCAAPVGAQEALVEGTPDRFFRPPYVGGRGWVGMRLDGDVPWDEVAELCEDAYRVVAPAQLVARLDSNAHRRRPVADAKGRHGPVGAKGEQVSLPVVDLGRMIGAAEGVWHDRPAAAQQRRRRSPRQ